MPRVRQYGPVGALLALVVMIALAFTWAVWNEQPLPDYGTTDAIVGGPVQHPEAREAFLAAYQQGGFGQWRMVAYTIEGDPITITVRHQRGWLPVRIQFDTRQDHFGPHEIDTYYCQQIMGATRTGLSAEGCWLTPGGKVFIP